MAGSGDAVAVFGIGEGLAAGADAVEPVALVEDHGVLARGPFANGFDPGGGGRIGAGGTAGRMAAADPVPVGREAGLAAGLLAGSFAAHLAAGYLANLAFAAAFTAAAALLAGGGAAAAVLAAAVLAGGGLAHPLFLLLGLAILGGAALLALRDGAGREARRLAAVGVAAGVGTGLGLLAMLPGPDPVPADTSKDAFLRRAGLAAELRAAYLDRFVRRWARYVQWLALPLAALGAAGPRRARGAATSPARADAAVRERPARATTLAFMTLALAQIFHLGNARSPGAVLAPRIALRNPYAIAAVIGSASLQLAAAYAGYRLLQHVGRIRDTEFMQVVLSSVEDCNPLLKDALAYSLEENVVALASFLEAVALFCWYKAVEVRPFLALCPHLLKRLDEIEGYVEGVSPDRRLVHAEEVRLERAYIARMMPIDDYPS